MPCCFEVSTQKMYFNPGINAQKNYNIGKKVLHLFERAAAVTAVNIKQRHTSYVQIVLNALHSGHD